MTTIARTTNKVISKGSMPEGIARLKIVSIKESFTKIVPRLTIIHSPIGELQGHEQIFYTCPIEVPRLKKYLDPLNFEVPQTVEELRKLLLGVVIEVELKRAQNPKFMNITRVIKLVDPLITEINLSPDM